MIPWHRASAALRYSRTMLAACVLLASAVAQTRNAYAQTPAGSPFRDQVPGAQASDNRLSADSQEPGSERPPGIKPSGTNPESQGEPQPNSQESPSADTTQDSSALTTSIPTSTAELRARITTRQSSIQADAPELSPEALTSIQAVYSKALSHLDQADSAQGQADKWKSAISLALERLANETLRSEQLNSTEAPPLPVIEKLDEGKRAVQEISGALNEVSTRLADLNREEAKRVKRRQELPELISKLRVAIPPVAETASDDTPPLLTEASQWAREAELLETDARVREYELELQAYTAENALLPLRIENDRKLEARLKEQLRQANAELDLLRNNQIETARYMAQQALNVAKTEAAKKQLKVELAHLAQWKELSSSASKLKSDAQEVSDTYSEWNERLQNIRSRVEIDPNSTSNGGMFNSWIGIKLRNQRDELPNEATLAEAIAKQQEKLHLAEALQFTLEDEKKGLLREKLAIERQYLDGTSESKLKKTKLPIWEKYNAINLSLDATTQMRQDVDAYISDLIDAATKHTDTINLVKEYREFIDRHILWIRSAQPLSVSDTTEAWGAISWLVSYQNCAQSASQLWRDVVHEPWWYAFFVLGIGVLVLNQSKMRRLLGRLSDQAARPSCADFGLTYRCTLLTIAISAPLSIFFLFLFWRLKESVQYAIDGSAAEHSLALAGGFALAAGVLFPLEVLRQVCRSGGLAIHHFGWSAEVAGRFRRNLRWFIDLGIPCVATVGILASQSDSRREVSLGRIAFILLMLVTCALFFRLFNPRTGVLAERMAKTPDGWLNRTRFAWFGAILCLPPMIALTSVVGYHYTAQRIAMHMNSTLWMLVLLVVIYSLLSRWLLLNRRTLIVAQARARLVEAAKRDSGESEIAAENSELDVVEINEQTKRLITSLVVTVGLVCGYFIWADVLPAIDILKGVTIWDQHDGQGKVTGVITLADALLVIPVIALVVIASRNVPGLLEIALLQHLPLTTAAKYAVTTLFRYLIIAVGIVASSNQLGIRWETVQWLVAALGVGLGFGLQEIFANFVSGIILLFEQPLRVGDIITIDGTTGTVTKIRMRATTIVNWDRQELIVPNKDLITGKLLNWTLSDTTNRIIVNVGVAYGSNMEDACQIIRQICEEHDSVLGDPGPLITFEGFGDNTLNIVVRAFLSSLDNRLGTIHKLHEDIYRQLGEAGIEIAFPQRDLHIKSLPSELTSLLGGGKGKLPASGAPQ